MPARRALADPPLRRPPGRQRRRRLVGPRPTLVRWDESRFPVRRHPVVLADAPSAAMPIAIAPTISFGRPVVLSRGISTAAIVARIDAGETSEDIAADYDLTTVDVEQAVLYERAA